MIDTIELQAIKTKFARLLSRLYTDAKFPIENINERLIKSDLLDCFENNQPDVFMRMSIEEISEKLGAGKLKFTGKLNEELYWSGIQYMNIFLNRMIPLKQILALVPINTMIQKFEIYHEMNDIEVLKAYPGFSDTSLLKRLRKESNHSIPELSYITGIPENSLKRYEKNNDYLFNASFNNIYSLKKFFKVDASLFCKKTAFIPYSEHLWDDSNFTSELKKQVCSSFRINESEAMIVRYSDSVMENIGKARKIIAIEPVSFSYTVYSDRILKKYLDEDMIKKAIYESILYAVNVGNHVNIYF